MKTQHLWNGVQMCRLHAAIDPDAPLQMVEIPESWDKEAATAILNFCPEYYTDKSPIQADILASRWIFPLCRQTSTITPQDWETLLLFRQACPNDAIWKNNYNAKLGITINLAAFASSEKGFNARTYRHALHVATQTLRILHNQQSNNTNGELPFTKITKKPRYNDTLDLLSVPPKPTAGTIYLSNLDACLAQLGYDYDHPDSRDIACCIACFTTLLANIGCGSDFLPLLPDWNALLELSKEAKELWALASEEPETAQPRVNTSFSLPNNVADLLLGVETCGFHPNFSPLKENGHLKTSTLLRLFHRGYTLETALAALLSSETILALPSMQSQYAMHKALVGFVTHMPAKPDPITNPLSLKATLPRGVRKTLPPRRKGITQKASIAGRSLLLRTNEYEDGSLGELSITTTKENTMIKGLLDYLSQAVTIGLQYGASLDDYVDIFAYSHFGISGTVEGDPNAMYATSILDYCFRALSDIYLEKFLPDAPNNIREKENYSPMLPFQLSEDGEEVNKKILLSKKRNLKLVS